MYRVQLTKKDRISLETVTQYRRRWFNGQATISLPSCHKNPSLLRGRAILCFTERGISPIIQSKKDEAYKLGVDFCLIRGTNGAKKMLLIRKYRCFQLVWFFLPFLEGKYGQTIRDGRY